METLGKTYFEVLYNNKDISADISQYLLSIRYNDKTGKEADELSLTLENVDALWENEWYPEKGAKFSAKLGDKNTMLDCGQFEIDEIEIAAPPDTVTIRAISAGVTGSLRSSKSVAHEKTTLSQIVNKVAADNHLTVEGAIQDMYFERITQNRECDLAFLRRLAEKYGFMFSVRGTKLVFTDMAGIMASSSIATIDRSDCTSYSIKDKSAKVLRKANISGFNPIKKTVVAKTFTPTTVTNPDGIEYQTIGADPTTSGGMADTGIGVDLPPTEDDYSEDTGADDESTAEATGKAAILQNATNQQEGTINIMGDPMLVAGVNFQFTGIGQLSGKYHISESEHSVDKESGYNTTLSIQRVGFIEISKHKRKTMTKKSAYDVKIIK
jgi:phage protein D